MSGDPKTVEDYNILRNVGRAVHKESQEAVKGIKVIGERDKINRAIILKHYEKIKPRFRFGWLLIYVGVAAGNLRDPER